jgi:hypothetical protein
MFHCLGYNRPPARAGAWSEFSSEFPGVSGLLSLLAVFRVARSTEHAIEKITFRQ